MTERDKVILLAERVMGWSVTVFALPLATIAQKQDGKALWLSGAADSRAAAEASSNSWNPFASISDAYELEAALPQDKHEEYIGWLECECIRGGFDPDSSRHQFAMVHATPMQRAAAVLAVVEAAGVAAAEGVDR